MGRLKREALQEEVHRFDDLGIPAATPDRQRSYRSAAMHLLQCNINGVLIFRSFGRAAAFYGWGSKPRTNSITLAEDIFARLQYRPRSSQSIEVEADDRYPVRTKRTPSVARGKVAGIRRLDALAG
jgi:hypothetical protein